jgi:dTDP-glucose 4,6-dehydratase
VEDICRTLVNILDNFKPGEVYNLGGDIQYEIQQVSDCILKHLGKDDDKVKYEKAEPFTTRIKTPDSTKAKKDLQFKLKINLDEGIKRTVEWFRTLYGSQ